MTHGTGEGGVQPPPRTWGYGRGSIPSHPRPLPALAVVLLERQHRRACDGTVAAASGSDRLENLVDDRTLALGFRNGDPAAMAALVRQHTPRLRAILARRGCPHQERDDLVQRTWLRAVDARRRLDPELPFGPWIAQIATRLWWDTLRRRRTRTEAGEVEAEHAPPGEAGCPSCQDGAAGADTTERAEILRALASLPHDQRDAILLTQYEGLSMKQAAAFTGTGVPGVKSRVSRGYAALRGYLETPEHTPPLPAQRTIELEVAGCERCEDVLRLVRDLACPSCEVEIREVEGDGPRLLVDGRHVEGLHGSLGYAGTLRALGVGLCADPQDPTPEP